MTSDNNGGKFKLFALDSIFVPTLTGFVRVSGEVANPGLFPFSPGQNAEYYINLAGGFLSRSDRKKIFRASRVSDLRAAGSVQTLIHDGDEIIVEIREELR